MLYESIFGIWEVSLLLLKFLGSSELFGLYVFVFTYGATFASYHEIERDDIACFEVFALMNDNILEIELIDRVEAERTALPIVLLFKLEILQGTGPAEHMAAFGYSRTHHFTYMLHADRTADIFGISHIHLDLYDVKPIELLICIDQVQNIISSIRLLVVLSVIFMLLVYI